MESMTVIFSDHGDLDTRVLVNMWRGLPNVKVVHITEKTLNARDMVDAALEAETDTILMCGHGSPSGLYSPIPVNVEYKGTVVPTFGYLVDQFNITSARKAKRLIGVWCNASSFAKTFKVPGFWTSMFISNSTEAAIMKCHDASPMAIAYQELLFMKRVNALLVEDVPLSRWVNTLQLKADVSIDIVDFNYSGLHFQPSGT